MILLRITIMFIITCWFLFFQITGPTITSAVIERRNTLRKRKELKKSFRSVIELQNVDQSKEEECNTI